MDLGRDILQKSNMVCWPEVLMATFGLNRHNAIVLLSKVYARGNLEKPLVEIRLNNYKKGV